MCGEQLEAPSATSPNSGSSPRVRGTGSAINANNDAIRFIPACAGNSGGGSPSGAAAAVHPRVCGEQQHVVRDGFLMIGSSPRVRGTVFPNGVDGSDERFIPACAGNSIRGRRAGGLRTVHPRVCGEQGCSSSRVFLMIGSSPRVRGTD